MNRRDGVSNRRKRTIRSIAWLSSVYLFACASRELPRSGDPHNPASPQAPAPAWQPHVQAMASDPPLPDEVHSWQGLSGAKAEKPAHEAKYVCPMHPDVHADKPGTCPRCHMKLVKEP